MFFHDVSWYLWVSVFLWPWVKSARLTKINADKLSPKGKAILCCVLLFALSCTNAANAISSVQGTLTCAAAPEVASAMPAWFTCSASWAWRRCATCAIASGLVTSKSVRRSIEDSMSLFPVSWNLVIHLYKSIVPLFCFMNCMNLCKNTFWAPLMKWGRKNL